MNKFLCTILICFATALNCFSTNMQGKPHYDADSLIEVTLEVIPDNPNKVNLVFKNISGKDMVLFSQFKNFGDKQPFAAGFRILFYHNRSLVGGGDWSKNMEDNYCLLDGKVSIKPNKSVSLEIDAPAFEVYEDSEFGIEAEVRYRYKVENDDQLHNCLVKTEYIQIYR